MAKITLANAPSPRSPRGSSTSVFVPSQFYKSRNRLLGFSIQTNWYPILASDSKTPKPPVLSAIVTSTATSYSAMDPALVTTPPALRPRRYLRDDRGNIMTLKLVCLIVPPLFVLAVFMGIIHFCRLKYRDRQENLAREAERKLAAESNTSINTAPGHWQGYPHVVHHGSQV